LDGIRRPNQSPLNHLLQHLHAPLAFILFAYNIYGGDKGFTG
jgi:hypothetical protein